MDKVITIDGPGGVGKGTVSRQLAVALGWDWLDSGALYRLTALKAIQTNVSEYEVKQLVVIASQLDVFFSPDLEAESPAILLEGKDVSKDLRTEACGSMASKIAALPEVRDALLQRQRDFATERGLVTDGRDMGTVVFPNAPLKFYLTATAQERASRRLLQLERAGVEVNFEEVLKAIEERDFRDQNREVAPLKPAEDAIVIDTTSLSVVDVYNEIVKKVGKLQK